MYRIKIYKKGNDFIEETFDNKQLAIDFFISEIKDNNILTSRFYQTLYGEIHYNYIEELDMAFICYLNANLIKNNNKDYIEFINQVLNARGFAYYTFVNENYSNFKQSLERNFNVEIIEEEINKRSRNNVILVKLREK